ncbi:solute carrier family 30 (zinc transporter), member 2 [Pancytospora epiphaga]|nr:solute carrier family 30 (zinc transporter), member 2 [Pancytospora epiphaga]
MKEHTPCISHTCMHDADISKIFKVSIIIFIFMIVELWGHFKTRSLSLLADSLHLLVDISGFVVSLLSLKLSKKNESSKMTWGYQRVEVLGALLSVILIWIAVFYLAVESFHKYVHPHEIDGRTFLGIAVIGLLVNLVCMYILHNGDHQHSTEKKNLNLRATYVHVIGDVIQSIGVIIASIVIYFYPKFVIADILCTLFFAGIVLWSTFYVIRDGVYILAEGAPNSVDQNAIKEFVLSEPAVIKITQMKIWSLSVNNHAIMLTILADNLLIKEYEEMLQKIRGYLTKTYKLDTINIQIDTPGTGMDNTGLVISGEPVCL